MDTVLGSIDVHLYDNEAPITCTNFLRYVNAGYYDYSMFHRSVPGFVFQGGGIRLVPTDTGYSLDWVPTYDPIVNEYSPDRPNVLGTIAMAKTAAGPDTATSQFFFNFADNTDILDETNNGGYTVFGYITSGMDVLAAMEALDVFNLTGGVSTSPFSETPTQDTYTQAMYDAGYGPNLEDLVWLYAAYVITDANNDGLVDATDYITLKQNIGTQSGATWSQGDFDFDGDVDYDDMLLYQFCVDHLDGGGVSPAPEPASAALLLVGGSLLLRNKRNKKASRRA